jgi:UDP-N-acetylmuramate dehydrogenase
MHTLTDNVLAHYVTMKIGGQAKNIAVANNEQDVLEIANYARENNLKLITIGSGSNTIFTDFGFDGIVLLNKISELIIDKNAGVIAAGAGILLDDIIAKSLETGLIGLEGMSGIPGTIGAAPVNNSGAYGQEIKDAVLQIGAYDTLLQKFVDIPKEQCSFAYRDSIFKSKYHGRYIITKVLLQLKPMDAVYKTPNYPSLITELEKRNISSPTPIDIRNVVLELRSLKLPDPQKLPNSGSFFKNPIVNSTTYEKLILQYPNMPHYPQANGREKLAAAWLIEMSGLKNFRKNGFWVYDKQPLVLINEKSFKFGDLYEVMEIIVETVKNKFNVRLEPEPEII